ncbi:MAG: indolepyruvate oxidoreductase subunit beta [Bacillota bacterium]
MKFDIVLAGVGGQGNILASRVLARAALSKGLQVRTSESIGMAQREGPVTSHVRMGTQLYGAIIPNRQADLIIGLELAETVRALPKLKPNGVVVASTLCIEPVTVMLGQSSYDREGLLAYLKQRVADVVLVDADGLARQAGNVRAANSVLLGVVAALPGLLPFAGEVLEQALLNTVKPKLREVNSRAFALGRQALEEKRRSEKRNGNEEGGRQSV